jgi:hypothetical protein
LFHHTIKQLHARVGSVVSYVNSGANPLLRKGKRDPEKGRN